jgi:hypothetical protein
MRRPCWLNLGGAWEQSIKIPGTFEAEEENWLWTSTCLIWVRGTNMQGDGVAL